MSDAAKGRKFRYWLAAQGFISKAFLKDYPLSRRLMPISGATLREASLDDIAGLYRELQMLDPLSAAKLEAGDSQRIVRALEVVKSTGKSIAYWQNQPTGATIVNSDNMPENCPLATAQIAA